MTSKRGKWGSKRRTRSSRRSTIRRTKRGKRGSGRRQGGAAGARRGAPTRIMKISWVLRVPWELVAMLRRGGGAGGRGRVRWVLIRLPTRALFNLLLLPARRGGRGTTSSPLRGGRTGVLWVLIRLPTRALINLLLLPARWGGRGTTSPSSPLRIC